MRARLHWLGAVAALALAAACGKAAKERPAVTTAPGPAATGAAAPAAPAAAPDQPEAAEPPDPDDASFFQGLSPAPKPAGGEPPELVAIKQRIIAGNHGTGALKEMQKLSYKYPKNEEVAYVLGQLYCSKLWMGDCLEAFRKALKLEPALRTNPYLIRAAVAGLGNDSDHLKVRHFLVQDIGKPAAPFVEEVVQGNYRQQVKDRASSILNEIK